MRLTKLSYKTDGWELENIEFENVSLIVGKNSTGKSKTIAAIDLLVKILTQKINLTHYSQEWFIEFINTNGDRIRYSFKTYQNENSVSEESLYINDLPILLRDTSDKALFKNAKTKEFEEIFPPESKLALHTSRDIHKFPYFEDIISWAEQSYGFRFGNVSPLNSFGKDDYNLLTPIEETTELYKVLVKETDNKIADKICDSLNIIGFPIVSIELVTPNHSDVNILLIREQGMPNIIQFNRLSQGLFRCLSLLIFIEYLIVKKQPSSIIIDDLCEGLDYERATKLGKLVFEKCLKNGIQLIATSNDAFLMDVVDLKYWNVLQRKGAIVTSINAKTNPALFENFKFTGLSNFDFFASDYIVQKNNQ